MTDRLELLSVSLLDTERANTDALKNLAQSLKLEFGWHYLLDISWILTQIDTIAGRRFIDAGAGTGIIQWYLADQGACVLSIDRESREYLAPRFRRRFEVEGLRQEDLASAEFPTATVGKSMKTFAADLVDRMRYGLDQVSRGKSDLSGKVIIYNQDLTHLADIEDETIDTIVAVSSLEHNTPQGLEVVVAELMRVLKPGGALLATLGAARNDDWFHEPSQGWCYSEDTLREIFHISGEAKSNYGDYDLLMQQLVNNQELKNNLASFYFKSGDNGMPWGKWKPEYMPVGVRKEKNEA